MGAIPHVLIVDEQPAVREVCMSLAQSLGYQASGCGTGNEALRMLEQRTTDILVADTRLPDLSGIDLLKRVKERWPALPVLIVTAHASVGTAVAAMKQGAADYLTKPFEGEEFKVLLQSLARRVHLESENRQLRQQLREQSTASGLGADLIGISPAMQRVFRLVTKVAQNRYPVLVLGESGTGKEVVARAIHYAGADRERPFIPIDCGSLVASLIESELFGHVKGAFTGATSNRQGLLEVANGGTVFLDEVAELPLDLQTKLLRAIQEREIRPVGSTKRSRIDARIIAATNRNLEAAVGEGSFRKDLFFRLNVVSIKLPALRERREDIPYLIDHFLDKFNSSGPGGKRFSDPALRQLASYDWPGNVRELENCVERTVALSSGPIMAVNDLPSAIQHHAAGPAQGPSIRTIAELERQAILDALSLTDNDKLLAAKKLGIGKTTLYRKLKEYRRQLAS